MDMLQIQNTKLDFKKKARSRIGSFENAEHVPGGGDIEVATHLESNVYNIIAEN